MLLIYVTVIILLYFLLLVGGEAEIILNDMIKSKIFPDVSLSTPKTDIDLYTPIITQITQQPKFLYNSIELILLNVIDSLAFLLYIFEGGWQWADRSRNEDGVSD